MMMMMKTDNNIAKTHLLHSFRISCFGKQSLVDNIRNNCILLHALSAFTMKLCVFSFSFLFWQSALFSSFLLLLRWCIVCHSNAPSSCLLPKWWLYRKEQFWISFHFFFSFLAVITVIITIQYYRSSLNISFVSFLSVFWENNYNC